MRKNLAAVAARAREYRFYRAQFPHPPCRCGKLFSTHLSRKGKACSRYMPVKGPRYAE